MRCPRRSLLPGGVWRDPRRFNRVDLARGLKVELEHTTDRCVAREIAARHLDEDLAYYQKLAKMERKR